MVPSCAPVVLHYFLLFQYKKQPGDTLLYYINWRVVLWTQWRNFAVKPPLRMTPDKLFLIVSQEEFKEYSDFLKHHDALLPFDEKERYFIRVATTRLLLKAFG